ncbi:hypothetical protein LSM04_007824 [Trypanosoma melophagium]|uniref:uncharacterized protein n=1 Tax=Trypanosoma melophagium TaxID=715481 RepID=UPI00351A2575|nr:hypothetical protein LSM04_007824 [Trypanosoma melophagium]
MQAVNRKAGSSGLSRVIPCDVASSVDAIVGSTGRDIRKPSINRNGAENDDFSDDEYSSSLLSEEMMALPATIVNGTANRFTGIVSLSEYETTDDEEEESESESSIERSGEYKPLGFSIVLGNQVKAQYRPRASSFHTKMSVEVEESESEVELEEKAVALNAIIINNLVKRLRDPSVKVDRREFEELNWNDPNFEEVLRALKQVVSYIEVKETMLKASKEGTIRSADRIEQKIKDILVGIPEVVVSKNRDKIIESAGNFKREGKTINKSESPQKPGKAHKNLECEGVLEMAGRNGVQGVSKESRMGAQPSKKKKITDSMILAEDATAVMKEANMSSAKILKKKKRESLILSQTFTYPEKEAVFSESGKPMRRRRGDKSASKLSLVFDTLPDEPAEEILETEYMMPDELQKKDSPEVLRAESANDGNKEAKHGEKEITTKKAESSSKKKRKIQRNRSLSLVVESLPEDTTDGPIHEKDVNLRTKGETSQRDPHTKKSGKSSSKKRRSQGHANNRSITFTEVADEVDREGIVEAIGEKLTDKPFVPVPPSESKTKKHDRRRRERNNASRSNISFAELPEVVDRTIEDDCANGIAANTTRVSGKSAEEGKEKRNNARTIIPSSGSHKKKEPVTSEKQKSVPESEKKKHRRSSVLRKSRELEYSFIPDEVNYEIKEKDTDSQSLRQAMENPSRLNGHHTLSRKDGRATSEQNDPNRVLPLLTPNSRNSSIRVTQDHTLSHSLNLAKLPDLAGSEIPDHTINSINAKKEAKKKDSQQGDNKSKKSRRLKAQHPNRSQTSFVALPDEDILELKENVGDMINGPVTGGHLQSEGNLNKSSSNLRSRRLHNSVACGVTSIEIVPHVALADNVEFPS